MTAVYAHITNTRATTGNLGDRMGFLIADALLGKDSYERQGIRERTKVTASTVGLVGSLVAAVCDTPATVVGGGLINGNRRDYSPQFRPLGVRGFLTQAVIERDGKQRSRVIGDPGLLLSRLVPMPLASRRPLGFIVHHVDREEWRARFPEYADCLVDNYATEEEFVAQLSRFKCIASTSLHGCVFSHAYGVPVAPFRLTDQVFGGDFKFRDYYSSYGLEIERPELPRDPELIRSAVLNTVQPTMSQIFALQRTQVAAITAALTPTRPEA